MRPRTERTRYGRQRNRVGAYAATTFVLAALACALYLVCARGLDWPPPSWPDDAQASDAASAQEDAPATDGPPASEATPAQDDTAEQDDTPEQDPPRAWDERTAPNYYEVTGPARIDWTLDPGTVEYAALDACGRAVRVRACVDAELAEAGSSRERKDVSDLYPSGWGNNREVSIECPNGSIYHGYFWNRSHLLAKSLGGDETIQNLVCGTRMQNVGANVNGTEGGMAYAETLARTYLQNHPHGFVNYSAAPVYYGDEPVCREVAVDVLSSDGSLDLHVVVYNAAKGYRINYETGDFHEC